MMSKRVATIGIVGLVLFATAFFLLREADPQAALRQATKRLLAEKTFRAELQAALVGLPASLNGGVVSNATGVDISLRSDIDRTDPAQQASLSSFVLSQDLAPGGKAVMSGEGRRKDGIHYLRFDAIQGVAGLDPVRLNGKWMKSPRAFMGLFASSPAAETPLDAADLAALSAAVRGVDLFTVIKKLPKETIDGARSYHYAVEMNMEVVSALLLKTRELQSGEQMTSDDVLAVTQELVPWGRPIGEVWIGTRDHRFKKIMLATTLGQDGTGGAAAATLLFTRYGQAVKIEVPEAEDAEKILGPIFGKRLSLSGDREAFVASAAPIPAEKLPTAPEAAASNKDSDGDGLADQQEFFYSADAWNPDTDGDGYSDGLEIEKGMDPVGPGPLFSFGL